MRTNSGHCIRVAAPLPLRNAPTTSQILLVAVSGVYLSALANSVGGHERHLFGIDRTPNTWQTCAKVYGRHLSVPSLLAYVGDVFA